VNNAGNSKTSDRHYLVDAQERPTEKRQAVLCGKVSFKKRRGKKKEKGEMGPRVTPGTEENVVTAGGKYERRKKEKKALKRARGNLKKS